MTRGTHLLDTLSVNTTNTTDSVVLDGDTCNELVVVVVWYPRSTGWIVIVF